MTTVEQEQKIATDLCDDAGTVPAVPTSDEQDRERLTRKLVADQELVSQAVNR